MGTEVVWMGAAAVPIVTGLTQVVAQTEAVPRRFLGLIAVLIALAGGQVAAAATDLTAVEALFQGVTVGLGASGLYSTQKNVLEGRNDGRGGD